jgi:malonyl-CoA O-methyltransferase
MERVRVSVEEGYAKWAPLYDGYPNALIYSEEPIVHELVGDVRGKRVLDVACGTGRHTLWLEDKGAQVTAVDRSAAMLAVAKAKRPASSVTWLEGDVAQLPVADASFDVVVNALVMEHVAHVAPAIAEARRVLAPGGVLVLSVFHPWFLLKGVPPHFEHDADGVEYELPAFVHHASEYVEACLAAGLRLTRMLEPTIDDAIIARYANMAKHRGLPVAIILRATAP